MPILPTVTDDQKKWVAKIKTMSERIKLRIDQKIDQQLKETFPASDAPNFEAIAKEAKAEVENENALVNKK